MMGEWKCDKHGWVSGEQCPECETEEWEPALAFARKEEREKCAKELDAFAAELMKRAGRTEDERWQNMLKVIATTFEWAARKIRGGE